MTTPDRRRNGWRALAAGTVATAGLVLVLGAVAGAADGRLHPTAPALADLAGARASQAAAAASLSAEFARVPAAVGAAAARESAAAASASAGVSVAAASVDAAAAARSAQRQASAEAEASAAASLAAQARQPGTLSTISVPRAGALFVPTVRLWRPDVPDSAVLPVVYLLHGVPGAPNDPFDAGLGTLLDAWVAHGGTPFVVAVPDGEGDHHTDTEWADASDGTDQIETWLVGSVVPAVEGAHPRDAAHRVLAGFSMGGYGALDLSLRHPTLASSVVSLAGYIHVDDPSGMFGGDAAVEKAHEPASDIAGLRGKNLFLADASSDTEPAVEGETQQAAKLLAAAGIPATVEITPGDHSWAWAMSVWPAVEAWLESGWNAPH